MALTLDGQLYTWGHRKQVNLGLGSHAIKSTPSLVERFVGDKVLQISSHFNNSAALVIDTKRSECRKLKHNLNDPSKSDVVFLLDNEDRVYANKSILTSHSEYFAAMFRSNMRECYEKEIRILDCCKDVFVALMVYLYCKEAGFEVEVEDIDVGHAFELSVVSDRYLELGLRSLCQQRIETATTTDNVLEFLRKSIDLHCDVMRDNCMGFLYKNLKEVMGDNPIPSTCIELVERGLTCDNVLVLLEKSAKYDMVKVKDACFEFVYGNFNVVTRSEGIKRVPQHLVVELLINCQGKRL
jgi:hypothetical protein